MMASRFVIRDTAFRMSHGKTRRPRIENGQHLKWIRSLPCLVSGARLNIESAHIRYADVLFGKREVGKGERPDDRWTVPLSQDQHRSQHAHGDEQGWWKKQGIDPLQVSLALYHISGDDEAGEAIMDEARRRRIGP